MRGTSSESRYVGPMASMHEAVVVSNKHKAKAAPMDHFLSDALAQVTILLYYNIKLKDGTITLNQVEVQVAA